MEKLRNLLDIKQEVLNMEFSYKNIQRLMFLVYESKSILENSTLIPNKEIALHQANKIIENELISLICTEGESDIKIAFNNLLDSHKLVLSYFT